MGLYFTVKFPSNSFLSEPYLLFPKPSEPDIEETHPLPTPAPVVSTHLPLHPQPYHLLYRLCHGEKFPRLLLPVLGEKLNVGDAEHSNKIKGVFAVCLTCKTREKAVRLDSYAMLAGVS